MNIKNLFFRNISSTNKKEQAEAEKLQAENTAKETAASQDLNNIPSGYYSQMEIEKLSPAANAAKRHEIKNYEGCLLGGAIGDALGWPIEFASLYSIKEKYGEKGVQDFVLKNGIAEITDDTQMTIFTADGLLKSAVKSFDENKMPDIKDVHTSYKDWLATQREDYTPSDKGWIANIETLYANRAPGGTCLGALSSGKMGTIEEHINNSKGCGGVMRTAPAGLMYYKNPKIAFETGARCAAITHGHPGGYLPGGVQAAIIANLIQGKNLEEAVDNSVEILKTYEGNEDTTKLIAKAKELAKSDVDPEDAIKEIGEGWVGDEAIAIAVYCALKSPNNFEKSVLMAVNHNGDSDSTGAITGNIMGAYLGTENIPAKWKNSVELSTELIQLAEDLYHNPKEIKDSDIRYQG